MSENSGKDSKANTPGAKPVKVVGAGQAASRSSESSAAQRPKTTPSTAPTTPPRASGAGAGAGAAAKKAAPSAPSGAAGAAKKAAPTRPATAQGATSRPAPAKAAPAKAAPAAPAKPASASATGATSRPAQKSAAPSAGQGARPAPPLKDTWDAMEDTAVRPGFGERLKGGLDKASARAETAAAKARAAREERRELAREPMGSTQSMSFGRVQAEGTPVAGTGAAAAPAPAGAREPRRARLRLSRIDPWSVAKVSFLLSIAFGVVLVVAVGIVWMVLGAAGVWDAVNSVVASVASSSDGSSSFDIRDYVGTGRVIGLTLVVSVVNVVLLTAMATLGAYLYNMAAALLGGVEVTLAEDHD